MADEINAEKTARPGHLEKGAPEYTKFGDADLHDKVLNAEARQATDAEHNLTFLQALKTYKRAAFWSIRKFLLAMTPSLILF
jgi:SP family general alpha glucoside:H+ symporter-like MFS transporter